MNYFDHNWVSNSDLKGLAFALSGRQQPENLQAIFDFGTDFHAGILEPHKPTITVDPDDLLLLQEMHATFWKDKMCRDFVLMPDFRREWEWYRTNKFGLNVRMKADGDSKMLNTGLELKGLKVKSDKAFHEAINDLNYDMGLAFYLDVSGRKQWLLPGISKIDPRLMFKRLVDRTHPYYQSGIIKVHRHVALWKEYSIDGQNLV